jgi:hypothetical protein
MITATTTPRWKEKNAFMLQKYIASIEILSKKYMFIIYKCIIYINELDSWIT